MTTLILAPHADDEVLGVGGSIAKLVAEGDTVVVAVLTARIKGKTPAGKQETSDKVRRECGEVCDYLGVSRLIFRELPAAFLDSTPVAQINGEVEDVIREVAPDQLFVPFTHDMHKDHAAIAYAATVACRPYLPLGQSVKRLLAYETLSETHLASPYFQPGFEPNSFQDISSYLDRKLHAMSLYKSQIQADTLPRSIRAIRSLAELRGCHLGVEAAEAFVLIREVR